jgi:hypothetical protein
MHGINSAKVQESNTVIHILLHYSLVLRSLPQRDISENATIEYSDVPSACYFGHKAFIQKCVGHTLLGGTDERSSSVDVAVCT